METEKVDSIQLWDTLGENEQEVCAFLARFNPHFGINVGSFNSLYKSSHKQEEADFQITESSIQKLIDEGVIQIKTLRELSEEVIVKAKNPLKRIPTAVAIEAWDHFLDPHINSEPRYQLDPKLHDYLKNNA